MIYACLIARGTTILAEFFSSGNNFQAITRRLLESIPSTPDSKKSYAHEGYNFNYLVEGGITYLCVSDSEGGLRVPYALLFDIANRFRATYKDKMLTAAPLAMNDTFSRVIQDRMQFFNNDKNSDKISKVKGEIDEAKNVMVKNIDKVLERGERIEMLVTKTEDLNNNAQSFRKKSTQLKRKMWWQNMKLCLLLICIIVIVLAVATLIILWKLGVFRSKHENVVTTTTGVVATSGSGSITSGYYTTGYVTSGQITTGQITSGLITSGQLTTSPLTSGDITTSQITSGLITTAPATSGDITTGDITTGVPVTTNALTTGDASTTASANIKLFKNEEEMLPKAMPDSSLLPSFTKNNRHIGRLGLARRDSDRPKIQLSKKGRNM